MQTFTGSVPNNRPPATAKTPSPSVPLSVYRDLATELQAAQNMLEALTAQNQKLVQENQLLRQEITQAVQFVLNLQKLVEPNAAPSSYQTPPPASNFRQEANHPPRQQRPKQRVARPRSPAKSPAPNPKTRRVEYSPPVVQFSTPMSEGVYFEEQEVAYYVSGESEIKEVNSWWLMFIILLIIISAFGTGYLIVRPLFENRTR
jgi:hypothetical protein